MKLSEPIPQVTFWNPRAKGKPKGVGVLRTGIPRAWGSLLEGSDKSTSVKAQTR